MENICLMRDIYRAIQTFEADFLKVHRVCLNEAMLLCSLSGGKRSAAEIAATNAMSPSHTSKVIRSVEEKGFVKRVLGEQDKRKMYFELTAAGKKCLEGMKCGSVAVPEILRPVFRARCDDQE